MMIWWCIVCMSLIFLDVNRGELCHHWQMFSKLQTNSPDRMTCFFPQCTICTFFPVGVCQRLVYICMNPGRAHEHIILCARVHVYVWVCVHIAIKWVRGFWRQGEPIDRAVRGVACSSRSSCPLGVKDTDVTALITEAGSQRYKHSQQQLNRALLG